ncbi:Yip1 family protein [Paenactinomyces guangxiensis]|uniref:YIP1 family protein n=1 Tax=Paenactinomyces guangxiensis TaxID=1490290 RepID=A0A7W1WUV9_9BACL|nr:Yip1 family protein [Paenactinomyces guangxiensis]MBA4496493.1 YIP1 family protein [Paenactinomyces guangxiensis]MBH8592861.1 YIP1 family protein [Paenactinomyces guangxiensis]
MEAHIQTEKGLSEKPSLIGMIVSPEKQYRRIKENPTIWLPMIILMVLATALIGLQMYLLVNDPQYLQQTLRGAGNVSLDIETMKIWTIGIGTAVGFLTVPFSSLLAAFFTWIFVMLMQGEAKFRQLFSFQLHLYVISLLSLIVSVILFSAFDLDPNVPATSLASIIPAEGAVKGLLSAIEVFAIWGTVLTASGLQVIASLSRGKAWTIAIIFWCVVAVFSAVSSLFQSFGA